MVIAGINLTKINIERTGDIRGKISVSNNVALKKIDYAKIGLPLKEKGIQVNFAFTSKYTPEIGKIEIEGNVLLLESEENAKKIMDVWQKNKKLPPELMSQLYTTILRKCNIKALVLSVDIGLPSPMRLPEVKVRTGQKPTQPKKESKTQKK
ncbi:hypothetical protein KY312_01710 [Candidatus Woesearchaeota archaeon]|nr:hypothetical protein [Candidatus Woesearchaeota archaeon]